MALLHGRRSFVSTLAVVAGAAVARVSADQQPAGTTAARPAGTFDMAWLDQMKGRHKQLYDLGGHDLAADPRPLRFGRNFLDTFRDVYHLESPDINTAVGISGPAFPMNASDRLWIKYKLGERAKIVDPMTKQPAVRNIFLDGPDISIKAMQARGTIFWQCNVALGNVAQQLADAFQMPVAEVRTDLIAGLNPGVRLMPSHVMALALAQEKGFTYMKP
jgi:intracellular sulfur oxidation DsrE/DsrF family protein